jgi:hypothetical protein
MVNVKTLGDTTWRDYETEGDSSSGTHWPLKSDARAFVDAATGANRGTETGFVQLVAFDRLDIDTSSKPFTALVPETLVDGDEFFFNDLKGTWANNAFTVDGNGTQIDDGSDTLKDRLICDVPGRFSLVWGGGVLRLRNHVIDHRKDGWTIATHIGERLVEEFDFQTSLWLVESGGVVSSAVGKNGTLVLTAAGAAQPTLVDGKGTFFDGENSEMSAASVGPIAVGADTGSIIWFGIQLGLDLAVRNFVSLGSSSNSRLLRINGSSHTPQAATSADVASEDGSAIGLCVVQGKFIDGNLIEVVLNGKHLASESGPIDTASTSLLVGEAFTGNRNAKAYFKRLLFVNGETSREEDARIAAELLGPDNWDLLHPDWQWLGRTPLLIEENLAIINAVIAAAPSSTPDQEPEFSPTPTMLIYDGDPLPGHGFSQSADVVGERALIALRSGWIKIEAGQATATDGILGYADVDNPTQLYDQATSFRASAIITADKLAIHVTALDTSRVRIIVRPVADGVGKYIDVDGHLLGGDTHSDKTIEIDFGVSAEREISVELPSGIAFKGFWVPSDGIIEPVPDAPFIRVAWRSDSFGSGTGANQRYNAFNILTADRLGLPRGQFAGNVGGGWESTSNGTVFNFDQGEPDVTDSDLSLRNGDPPTGLGITALTFARAAVIALGVNDANMTKTAAEWTAIILPLLQRVRRNLPWAPIILPGPWDRFFPSAVSPNWRAVDDGLQAAVAAMADPYIAYLSMEGVDYDKVGGGNIHPTNLGHQQLADDLAPRIKAALLAMA